MRLPSFCNPTIVMLVASSLTLGVTLLKNFSWVSLFFNAVLIALWTIFLNFLCAKNYLILAWILAALPAFSAIFMIFLESLYLLSKGGASGGTSKGGASASMQNIPRPEFNVNYYPDEESAQEDEEGYY
jgi:hypothetical protein